MPFSSVGADEWDIDPRFRNACGYEGQTQLRLLRRVCTDTQVCDRLTQRRRMSACGDREQLVAGAPGLLPVLEIGARAAEEMITGRDEVVP